MLKYVLILCFTIVLSNDYNVIINNQLDYSDQFTFEDMLNKCKERQKGKFRKLRSGGVYSDNFPFIPYLEFITFEKKLGETLFFISEDGSKELKVTADNFQEFRENFITNKCLAFDETDFPAKVFKVKSQDNISEITFYDMPSDKSNILDNAAGDLTYYVYSKKDVQNQNGEEETYFLVGKKDRIRLKEDSNSEFLGWVLAFKEEKVQQVVLWNTNLGIRPKAELDGELKPLVFNATSSGGISHSEYVDNQTITEDDLIMSETSLDMYNQKFDEKRGLVLRWLPNYVYEGNEYGVKVGLMMDYDNLVQDILQGGTADVLNVVLVVDASLSMDYTWNSLRPVLDMTIKNLEKQTVMNAVGQEMTPRFKVWAYHLNSQQVTSDWIEAGSNFDYDTEIRNACCTGSQSVRPALSETLRAALADVSTETAYIMVIGDASDRDTQPGEYLSEAQVILDSYDSNYFKALRGIQIYSKMIYDSERNVSYDPSYQDFINAYNEFENHFEADLLTTVRGGSSSTMSTNDQENLAEEITTIIKDDMDITFEAIQNVISSGGSSTNVMTDRKMKNVSGLSQRYIEKLKEARQDWVKGTGTFYDEGLIVSNDMDGETLVNTDILVGEEALEELLEYIEEYTLTEDPEDAKRVVKNMLAIFFGKDESEIDSKFLSETTIGDLWRRVVGNQEVADKLVPSLFDSSSDATFEELLEELELAENEEIFLANCQSISNNLIEQTDNKESLFVASANTQTNDVDRYYWILSDNLQLFKGIVLD